MADGLLKLPSPPTSHTLYYFVRIDNVFIDVYFQKSHRTFMCSFNRY